MKNEIQTHMKPHFAPMGIGASVSGNRAGLWRGKDRIVKRVQGFKIWIARHADSGKGTGYLVTEGKQLFAFVRSPGERGLELAHAIAADPSRMIAPATLIRKSSSPAGEEIRVDDLRNVTVEGECISAPVFLLNCYFFPSIGSGKDARLPRDFHAMGISLSSENGTTRLRLAWHQWLDASTAPAWLNMAGPRKEKTARHRIKINSRPTGTVVEADQRKAA